MKIKLLLVIIFMIQSAIFAQTDSINDENIKPLTKLDTIAKERSLLIENFLYADYKKVKEIKDFLKGEIEDEDHLVLFDEEYWLILYWTREYEELLQSIRNHENEKGKLNNKIFPPEDWLYDELFTKSKNSRIVLRSFIKSSELEDSEKDFLLMHLEYLTTGAEELDEVQEELNLDADKFLESYENSEYEGFTKKYIRYRTVPSPWAGSINFFTGYGIFTHRLRSNFSNHIPIGLNIGVEYQRFAFSFRAYFGFSETKKEISFPGAVWEEGSAGTVFLPQFGLGYNVLDSKRFKITPFGAIGGTSIRPTPNDIEYQPNLENAGLDFTVTYSYGVNLDFKLDAPHHHVLQKNETAYWFIRLRYEYIAPQFKGYFRGNMHAITIGIGAFGRDSKRVY